MAKDRQSRNGAVIAGAFLAVAALLAVPALSRANGAADPEVAFAEAYARELAGEDVDTTLAVYRGIIATAGTNRMLAAKAWWRVGVCERLRERWEASREAWRTVASRYADCAPMAEQSRNELRELERMLERVQIEGRVVDSEGRPVPQAFVMAGDWVSDPPALCDKAGQFRVERRAVQASALAPRHTYVYAEHPQRAEAAIQAVLLTDRMLTGLVVQLRPTVDLGGRVVDPSGRAVEGVRVSISAADPASGVPLPYENVLSAVSSDSNGSFAVQSVIEGLPVLVAGQKPGYRPAELRVVGSRARLQRIELTLVPSGRVGMEGVVTDERGQPLDAVVSAYAFTPDEAPVASAHTDLNGHYRLTELPDSPLTLLAEAAGYGERRISGVRPGYRRMDFVLSRPVIRAPGAVAPGSLMPDLDVVALNAAALTAGSLKHHVALLYFWSRPKPLNPPALLEDVQRRYGDAGLRVICIHDASALPEDLATTTLRQGISYTVAIDRYVAATGTGLTHNATFDAFGVRGGDAVAVDAQGVVAWCGRLHDPAAQAQLDGVLAGLVAEADPGSSAGARRVMGNGLAVPPLQVRWVRGHPVSGAAPREGDLRGRVVVYRFGSVFAEAARHEAAVPEESAIGLWTRAFPRESVLSVWVLPSGEGGDEATRTALALAPDAMIAVDAEGATYRAFGAGESAGNTVADGDGRVAAAGIRDEQVFGVIKRLLAGRAVASF